MFSEYVGLSQRVASLIEAERLDSSETKDEILWRILKSGETIGAPEAPPCRDFGQGVLLPVGEKLYLFLSKPNGADDKPDGIAEVRLDGLYLDGKRIEASHGSEITPAMRQVQIRSGHFNARGQIVSLSAYRQWHVVRDGRLIALDELKTPDKKRRRTTKASKVDVDALLAELGIK